MGGGRTRQLRQRVLRLSLIQKVGIGYILIIFIPVCLSVVSIYRMSYRDLLDNYAANRRNLIEQAYSNLLIDLNQTAALVNVVESSREITEYLAGYLENDAEIIYRYSKYIVPLLGNLYSSTPNIEPAGITIYSIDADLPSLRYGFDRVENLAVFSELEYRDLIYGTWRYDPVGLGTLPSLSYHRAVFDDTYTRVLGIVSVHVSDRVLDGFLAQIGRDLSSQRFLFSSRGEPVFSTTGQPPAVETSLDLALAMERCTVSPCSSYRLQSGTATTILGMAELRLFLVDISDIGSVADPGGLRFRYILGISVLLLLVLSGIYFVVTTSITKRILRLERHMTSIGRDNLRPIDQDDWDDEIGILTSTFNNMIRRIDGLVNKVHRTELLRKEAEYATLRAQIKPHFLYNTLESIRMLAVANDDTETADACFAFGRFLRYRLVHPGAGATVSDEIRNVEDYLKIHRLRMGARFTYEIIQDCDAGMRCPQHILQPLVENSIMHGLSNRRRSGHLSIRVFTENGSTVAEVLDDGKGISPDRLRELTELLGDSPSHRVPTDSLSGLGIVNVHERVRAFFGPGSGLSIASEHGAWTRCRLEMRRIE